MFLRVFTGMQQVRDHLTHPRFQMTDSEEDADVVWAYVSIKDYRSAPSDSTTLTGVILSVCLEVSLSLSLSLSVGWSVSLEVGLEVRLSVSLSV